jgi:hypothetical protein
MDFWVIERGKPGVSDREKELLNYTRNENQNREREWEPAPRDDTGFA